MVVILIIKTFYNAVAVRDSHSYNILHLLAYHINRILDFRLYTRRILYNLHCLGCNILKSNS